MANTDRGVARKGHLDSLSEMLVAAVKAIAAYQHGSGHGVPLDPRPTITH